MFRSSRCDAKRTTCVEIFFSLLSRRSSRLHLLCMKSFIRCPWQLQFLLLFKGFSSLKKINISFLRLSENKCAFWSICILAFFSYKEKKCFICLVFFCENVEKSNANRRSWNFLWLHYLFELQASSLALTIIRFLEDYCDIANVRVTNRVMSVSSKELVQKDISKWNELLVSCNEIVQSITEW